MKVILKEYVRKVGDVGDVVDVRDGFARNFLLPQEIAIPATQENLKRVENIRKHHQEKHKHLVSAFHDMAQKLSGKSLTLKSKVNEAGRLYGSIGEKELAASLNESFSVAVDPNHIEIGQHFKDPGKYNIHLRFTVGVTADVSFEIIGVNENGEEVTAESVRRMARSAAKKAARDEKKESVEGEEEEKGEAEEQQ